MIGSMRTRSPLLLAALAAIVATGCDRAADTGGETRPNVLLITVDTLRPDALGWIAGSNATPAIDALAREGAGFPTAVAHAPLTLPSHTSIMTGLYPPHHGVRDNGQIVSQSLTTLADRLRDNEYHTAAFVSGFTLQGRFGLDKGFDHYDDRLPEGVEGWLERDAMSTTAAALDHIRGAKEPWFLWVHYFDPHDPYAPPPEYAQPGPRGAYDGEVAFTDAAIARLLAGLPGSDNPTITVFTADHAESLGEHEENGHGVFIYDTTMVVPLIFHAPGLIAPGISPRSPRLVDIAPTLLDLLGLPPLPDIDGLSLEPLLAGEAQDIPPAYVESRMAWIAYGWAPLSGMRDHDWKYIRAPEPELYDLLDDPGETSNVRDSNLLIADSLDGLMDETVSTRTIDSETSQNQDLVDRLRSLGYLGAGRYDTEPPDELPDPKDRHRERRLLELAEGHLRAGQFDQALARFEQVLALEPNNRFANLRTGIAHLKRGDVEAAILPLRRSVELDPEQPEARFALADALSRSGRTEAAIEQWLETVRLQPRRTAAWANLGTLLARADQPVRAREALLEAFRLDPDDATILANIVILDGAGDTREETISMLLDVAGERASDFQHHAALGLLLVGVGDTRRAKPWLQQARPEQHGFAEARWQLALILGYSGDSSGARQALAAAMASDPGIAERARNHPMARTWIEDQ